MPTIITLKTRPPADLTGYYQWSPNLTDWYPSGDGPSGGPIVTFTPVTRRWGFFVAGASSPVASRT